MKGAGSLLQYRGPARAQPKAGEYLLKEIFRHLRSFDDPVVASRRATGITYPHSPDAVWEQGMEHFEGLARSFFVTEPLTCNRPELEVCGCNLREYCKPIPSALSTRTSSPNNLSACGQPRALFGVLAVPVRNVSNKNEYAWKIDCKSIKQDVR